MKLAKIAKQVIKTKLCDVYGAENGTGLFISTGQAIYRVDDLPMPGDGDQMLVMLDIPEKQRGGITCRIWATLPPLDMAHTASGEMAMVEHKIETGSNCMILVDEDRKGEDKKKGKLAFVDEELLAPLRGDPKEYIGYACRFTAEGRPYIIIKDGMYAIAAVVPRLVDARKIAKNLPPLESICLSEAERESRGKDDE